MSRARRLLALLLLASCHRTPGPVPDIHYTVGTPYEMGGTWSYPRESFDYDRTGLAERLPTRAGRSADGEVDGPAAMTGAHRTLQLPAIVTVTNLENGRQIRVRVNDRGPSRPGRVIGLSPKAADLIGLNAGQAAQVRVQVDNGASQALRDRLGGAPAGTFAAPVAAVTAEPLSGPGVPAARSLPPPPAAPAESPPVPEQLPAVATQTGARPGQVWIEAGRFSSATYANAVKSRLSPLPVEIRREGGRRGAQFSVMAGPFTSVADADRALDQALAAGVTDASIVVE